jgi:RNA 3'-terminal phosphate cyclase-like protein
VVFQPPLFFTNSGNRNSYRSPGYALTLLAESTTSGIHCAEAISEAGVAPEDIGLKATRALLAEIEKGGCVDQKHQTLVLLMMVLGSEDVGRCRMGEPTPKTYVALFTCSHSLLIFFTGFNF